MIALAIAYVWVFVRGLMMAASGRRTNNPLYTHGGNGVVVGLLVTPLLALVLHGAGVLIGMVFR